jgi:hypothetical protein
MSQSYNYQNDTDGSEYEYFSLVDPLFWLFCSSDSKISKRLAVKSGCQIQSKYKTQNRGARSWGIREEIFFDNTFVSRSCRDISELLGNEINGLKF